MLNFLNDYNNTAHPRVLEAILAAEGKRFSGYGTDEVTAAAAETARLLCGQAASSADVHFLPGGTMTNLAAIGAFLRPHEAAISLASAHIYMHESGAIEAAGHKILNFPSESGKADAVSVRAVCEGHTTEHMVKPKLLFISQATELGTVYTRAEISALREVCDEFGLYLYIDGARLANALVSASCDMSLEEIAGFADAFYIGGTKNGLLFGEALVIVNPALKEDFRFLIKQRGGLLAKGFLLGIQFRALFCDDLWLGLARHANGMAGRLRDGLSEAGVTLFIENDTNQVFLYAPPHMMPLLEERVLFEQWGPEEEKGVPIRFVTSWATTEDEVEALLGLF